MLTVLGFFGLIAVGLVADSVLSSSPNDEDEDGNNQQLADTYMGEPDKGDILDLLGSFGGDDQGSELLSLDEPLSVEQDDGLNLDSNVGDLTENSSITSPGGNLCWLDEFENLEECAAVPDDAAHVISDSHLTADQDVDHQLAGAGNDAVFGGPGNDVWMGGVGDDWLVGADGHDSLAGGGGGDVLDGGAGNDWLSGLDDIVDDASTDFLNGGAGDDRLVLGSGDYALGGAGADGFTLTAQTVENGPATISDFDVAYDTLVVMYDARLHPDPHLCVETDDAGTQSTIKLNGSILGVVYGGPVSAADIQLVASRPC